MHYRVNVGGGLTGSGGHMSVRGRVRGRLLLIAASVACLLAAAVPVPPAIAEDPALAVSSIPSVTGADAGSMIPTAGTVLSAVDEAEISASGATITVAGGKKVHIDFSGKNATYLKFGVLAFCASVFTRLLNTLSRIMRPFTHVRRRRRRRDLDEYEE